MVFEAFDKIFFTLYARVSHRLSEHLLQLSLTSYNFVIVFIYSSQASIRQKNVVLFLRVDNLPV